jgi:glutathione S-transferase
MVRNPMKLFGTTTSPFVRKVRVVLAEKKIESQFIIEAPRAKDSRVPQINPLGQIPVLLVDENTAIFDSRVIVEYLDNLAPNNKLLPQTNRDRTEVKRWEATADGLLDAAVAIRMETTFRPPEQQSAAYIDLKRSAIDRSLAFMDEELGEQPYCRGIQISLADIAVGCALGYLSFRFPELDWRTPYPALAKLADKLNQRPSFADTTHHE